MITLPYKLWRVVVYYAPILVEVCGHLNMFNKNRCSRSCSTFSTVTPTGVSNSFVTSNYAQVYQYEKLLINISIWFHEEDDHLIEGHEKTR